jgi:asparagine synthase (glutamine-hydrolysing)
MRLAHEAGVKVLLDGQGADELLAGYERYASVRVGGALRSLNIATVGASVLRLVDGRAPIRPSLGYAVLGSPQPPARLILGRMPESWLGPTIRSADAQARLSDAGAADALGAAAGVGTLLAQRLWRDIASDSLPALLRYEDRNSMAFGIEARVPFLDHRLVEIGLALPDRLKIDSVGRRKIVLQRAMQGIVPDTVLARRDKVGFEPPQRRWLRDSERMWRDLGSQSRTEADGLLAPGTIGRAVDGFMVDRTSAAILWRALNLELWLRRLS